MKFAIRQLAKSPGFTAVALLTLALAVGANTTAFTILNRLLLQALPYRDPVALVQVEPLRPHPRYRERNAGHAAGDFCDEEEQNTVFTGMAAYVTSRGVSFAEPGQPAVREGRVEMTANLFTVLGVPPQLGRLPSPGEEARSEPVTLLSYAFWRQHFGSNPDVLGQQVKLDAKMYTIVGIMPPQLDDPELFFGRTSFFTLSSMRLNRDLRNPGPYTVAARLKPGVTLDQAQSQMTVLAARLAKDHPATNSDRTLQVIPFPSSTLEDVGRELTWMTMALAGFVLLIACANLANLQLVRATGRERETSIRLALGCPRRRLVGMFLVESMMVAVAGGLLGLVVAKWSNDFAARYFNIEMPLDLRVIGFTFALSLATGALFGTLPALLAVRTNLNETLKAGARAATAGRRRQWMRRGLVVLQLALALTLLTGAGFFVRGIYRLTHRNLGWDAGHQVMGWIMLDHDRYGEWGDLRSEAFSEQLRDSLAALPGVTVAAVSSGTLGGGGGTEEAYRVEDEPPPEKGREAYADRLAVSPGFLQAAGLHLVEGRDFRASDRPGSPAVVIVTESLAKRCWPHEDPIGKRIGGTDPGNPNWAEVVGVVRDYQGGAEFYNPDHSGQKFLRPWAQNNQRIIAFEVRTAGPSANCKEPVRKAMSLLAPDLAVGLLETVEDVLDRVMRYYLFLRRILVQIAILGVLLSALGIYGVVANLASERTKEIGIRMALGAQPGSVVRLFVRDGLQLVAIGAALGLVAGFFLVEYLQRLLPALPGRDPQIIAAMALILVGVAVLASWLPAQRTTRISPTVALRAE